MAFQTSISASHFSALAVSEEDVSTPPTTSAGFQALFTGTTGGDYQAIENIRDLPSIGSPANIVKVPVYGQRTTQSVGAQADAPDLELTINYVASDWAAGTVLGDYVGDGVAKAFQFSLLGSEPVSLNALPAGLGQTDNASWYFIGKIESILINPSRDDATTATVALSIQSEFIGPVTLASA